MPSIKEFLDLADILEEIEPEAGPELAPAYPLPQLAAETGHTEAELGRWVQAIERKGQAIFYGPPGTGKTYLAERLARHLTAESDGFAELVQFHPAYAYEDFIQGIRPQTGEGGRLTYPMLPGRFLDFCHRAANRDGCCVLIIDEINRANLSRVFGELMYLLEYRKQRIPLSGGGRFYIPENVRLIGTMNTADRSIALVDHALRRRFAFIRLAPNYAILRRYHQDSGFPVEGLINILTRLNNHIADPHYEIGHTFFLQDNLSAELPDIWQMEIEPYLEEYFFDRPNAVDTFRWESVEQELS
jgi:5-methylcytosine-specific restriction protein B